MAKRNMKTCVYVSDDNKEYLKRLDARYQSQDDGGSPAALLLGAEIASSTQLNTLPNVPRDLKPRHVILATSDGTFVTRLPVFQPGAYFTLQPPQTLTAYDGQGSAHTVVVRGHEGEHSMHKSDIT
jgi:hypothetical protein